MNRDNEPGLQDNSGYHRCHVTYVGAGVVERDYVVLLELGVFRPLVSIASGPLQMEEEKEKLLRFYLSERQADGLSRGLALSVRDVRAYRQSSPFTDDSGGPQG